MALAAVIAGSATPARSWVHPVNQDTCYFMPGGPEEHYLNGCIVNTRLLKEQRDIASISVYAGTIGGLYSNCAIHDATIRIVTFNGTTVENREFGFSFNDTGSYALDANNRYDYGYAESFGKYGQALIGAQICASNTNGLVKCWDITAF